MITTDWAQGAGFAATFKPSVGAGQEFNSLPDGSQVAAISGNTGTGGEIYQPLSATLAANTTYTLTFWVGQRADVPFDNSYRVSLQAGGIDLASNSGASPAAGDFVQQTIVLVTGSSPAQLGDALTIDVFAPANSLGQADFDLFALNASPNGTAAIPEPSFAPLMGTIVAVALLSARIRSRPPGFTTRRRVRVSGCGFRD